MHSKKMTVLTVKAALDATPKNPQTISRCRKYAQMQGYSDDSDFCEFVARSITHESDFIDFSKCAAWQSNSARLNGLSAVAAVVETDCVRERLDSPGAPYKKYVEVKKKLVQLQQRFKNRLHEKDEKDAVVEKVDGVLVDVDDDESGGEVENCEDGEDGEDGEDCEESDSELEVLKILESQGCCGAGAEEFRQHDYMLIVVQQSRKIRDLELQLAALKKMVSARLNEVLRTLS